MKTRLNVILAFFMALVVQISFAQEKTISGTVSDETGPLPGVNVIIKGTTSGTETDFDGNFTIEASEGQTLVFSYVGMQTLEQVIGAGSTIDVVLSGDNMLNEVVVVGYGTTTKASFTGTAAKVDSDAIEAKSTANVTQALTGEVAGVTVINNSGQPGSTAEVRIRGLGSVNGSQSPLYVIDGIPYDGGIDAINPSDIASTVILKDATATAVYGARGANGVILITTRKGKTDQAFIDVELKQGINYAGIPRQDVMKDPEAYIALGWEGLKNGEQYVYGASEAEAITYANNSLFSGVGISPSYNMWNVSNGGELIDPVTGMVRSDVTRKYNPENWEDYAFQSSDRTEANIKISGGSEKSNYFMSVGFLDDQGYVANSDYERVTFRTNVSHRVKPWLKGSLNMGYSTSTSNNNGQSNDSGSVFWFVDNIPSIYPLYLRDSEGNMVADPIYGGNQYDYGVGRGFGALTNAVADAEYQKNETVIHNANVAGTLDFQLSPSWTIETRFGLQYRMSNYNNLNNPFYGSAATSGGSVYKEKEETRNFNALELLRWKKSFGDHSLNIFVAHENTDWSQSILTVGKSYLSDPNNDELNNAVVQNPASSWTDSYALESYFGQASYDFAGKYFFSGTIRRDGSSRFLNEKWGTFWSLGGGWILSEEEFMSEQNAFDYLKLKASYGLTGDQAGVGYYPGVDQYSVSNIDGEPAWSLVTKGNPDLTWETAKQFQVGTEMTIFNKLDVNIDYFRKVTDDLIFDRRVGPSIGYAIIKVNDGQLLNDGLEFDVKWRAIESNNWKFNIGVNGAFINNELTQMPIDPATNEEKVLDLQGIYGRSVGHSLYDIYTREWAGVDSETGFGTYNVYFDDMNDNGVRDSGETISSMTPYLDANPDANVLSETTEDASEATLKYVDKSGIPALTGAVNFNLSYKSWTLGTQLLYGLGGYSMDYAYRNLMGGDQIGNNNYHVDIQDRWQKPGDVTDVPGLFNGWGNDQYTGTTSTRWITKRSYLALNNIRLGYDIPKSTLDKWKISRFNISASGDNLWMTTSREGYNPTTSISGASDTYTYSPLSTVTLALRVQI